MQLSNPITLFPATLLWKLALSMLLCVCLHAHADNQAAFNFTPASHWDVPFPNDLFTLPNSQMLTQRRVNLPLPLDEGMLSERRDTESVNVLDGFSIFPRITVPLAGADPDPDSFTSAHVFLVALAPAAQRGRVIAVDQRIVDTAIPGAPRLVFAPDEYLMEQSRYALVVTTGLTGAGQPFLPNSSFQQFVDRHRRGVPATGIYEALLYNAMDTIVGGGIAAHNQIATLSVFTTRTVSDLPVKFMRRLTTAEFPITPARFEVDAIPGLDVVRAADVQNLDTFVHRASVTSDGTSQASFPPGALRVQNTGVEVNIDLADEIYVENVRLPRSIRVPAEAIDAASGAIAALDVSTLEVQAGDELALLVRKRRLTPASRPYFWGSLQAIVFGVVDAPRYTSEAGTIPFVSTGAEFVPPQTGTDAIVFALFLPKTTAVVGASLQAISSTEGWPVAHVLHGGAESKSSFLSSDVLNTAPLLASRGIATVSFNAAEFDGGPRSRIHISTSAGVKVIPGTGRAFDIDGNGLYEQTELYVYPQRVSDLAAVIRSLQLGVDLNGDGRSDLARDPEHTHVVGVSFGGATALIAAALEPNASVFVANVPSSEGSRARGAGFHPLVAERGRSFAQEKMATRTPSLLNTPSPRWGGMFDEDIPLKQQPVQLGMVPGAEAIQRAFDFNMWRDLENMPLAFAHHAASGILRGSPANLLVQVARGDGAAVNPIQAQMIRAGQLQSRTAVVRLDQEPLFDSQWAPSLRSELARHVLVALPYAPRDTSIEVGGRICHYARAQIAEFLRAPQNMPLDPDGEGTIFAGDVFQFPISDALLEEMVVDPGLPTPAILQP